MLRAKVKVNFPDTESLVEKLGFKRGGVVQKTIDTEIIQGVADYVPKDLGNLRDSVLLNDGRPKVGDGLPTWDVYGHANGRNTWNDTTSKFQEGQWSGGLRGPFWVLRFWNNGGKERVIKTVNELLRRK